MQVAANCELILEATSEGISLDDVEVRLARREERRMWDALVDTRNYPGFQRFVAFAKLREWRGSWFGLAGWQSVAFKNLRRAR